MPCIYALLMTPPKGNPPKVDLFEREDLSPLPIDLFPLSPLDNIGPVIID